MGVRARVHVCMHVRVLTYACVRVRVRVRVHVCVHVCVVFKFV